ncbi:hypothetical protein [Calothrix rhizosoleniae]|uniref:hypothetical protein n=1 Tax=Calothrix rhizosoleniae TaxID=888997 RepID=UPI001356593A|nr:hypothetical protein [Calothrix rhizosoleniae]
MPFLTDSWHLLFKFALGGETGDEEAKNLVASGLVQAIDLKESFDSLTRLIKQMLSTQK